MSSDREAAEPNTAISQGEQDEGRSSYRTQKFFKSFVSNHIVSTLSSTGSPAISNQRDFMWYNCNSQLIRKLGRCGWKAE